jgi:5-methyltetrahydrofolate--homocysteine methyltransferase
MAEYARLARDAGAKIIGGCCGTSPAHLAAMRDALDRHTPRGRPDAEAVIAALGPLASPPSTATSTRRPNRRRAV